MARAAEATFLAGLLSLGGGLAAAQSFDCARAGTPIEHAICADAELALLDEHLGHCYERARGALGPGRERLREEQRAWLATERASCGADGTCLRGVYLERLRDLGRFQAGAGSVRFVELPAGRVMITALPPEPDMPPPAENLPLILEGILDRQWDQLDDGGIVLRTDDGRDHVLVLPIDLDNTAAHRLLETIRYPSPERHSVFGQAGATGEFALGACRFVYVLAD
jgi:uncharacterized protein YecT (DUF1311 family)